MCLKRFMPIRASSDCCRFCLPLGLSQADPVTGVINFSHIKGRMELIFTLVQVYRLLEIMGRQLPQLAARYAMFESLERPNGTTITFMPDGVIKEITDFGVFSGSHGTSLAAIQRAYEAAAVAATQVLPELPFLNTAVCAPSVNRRHKYHVKTGPLGYEPDLLVSDICASAF
jgi:hypothetical protein